MLPNQASNVIIKQLAQTVTTEEHASKCYKKSMPLNVLVPLLVNTREPVLTCSYQMGITLSIMIARNTDITTYASSYTVSKVIDDTKVPTQPEQHAYITVRTAPDRLNYPTN